MNISTNREFLLDIVGFHNYVYYDLRFVKDKIVSRSDLFTVNEMKEVVEAFVIKIIAEWDIFIEKSLVHLAKDNTSKLSEFLGLTLPHHIGFDTCQAILNGLNYFDIKSSSNLKSIAKKILTDPNNPFPTINNYFYKAVDELYIIRNYVAHKSKPSKRSLMNMYKKYGQTNFLDPGHFLLEVKDERMQWVNYIGILIKISTDIWKYVDTDTYERIFKDAYLSSDSLKKSLDNMNKFFNELKNGS